jgi:hypothetical protein
MTSPLIPAALFVSFFVALSASLPLAGTAPAFALMCVAICMVTFLAIIWWTVRTDAEMDPRQRLTKTLDRFDERWPKFERDFWAHVAAVEGRAKLD